MCCVMRTIGFIDNWGQEKEEQKLMALRGDQIGRIFAYWTIVYSA
jgi:hypothetical protein